MFRVHLENSCLIFSKEVVHSIASLGNFFAPRSDVTVELPDNCPPLIDYFDTKSALDIHGIAGPFPLSDTSILKDLSNEAPAISERALNRHMDLRAVKNIFGDQHLRAMLAQLCGEDLVVWRTGFFRKAVGEGEVGWHHDKHFQSQDEPLLDFDEIATHFSFLLAVDEMGTDNGRLEVIPGSHRNLPGYDRDRRAYHNKPSADHFIKDIPSSLTETRRAVTLNAGEFILFHSGILHRSLSFFFGKPRFSFAVRLTPSHVQVPKELNPQYLALT